MHPDVYSIRGFSSHPQLRSNSFILLLIHCVILERYRSKVQEYRIRSSEKFLSFYKDIIDARYFPFYIILSNYVRSISFYQNKHHDVRQIRFHVCIKMHRCKRRIYKRKTLFGQPNILFFCFFLNRMHGNVDIPMINFIERRFFVRKYLDFLCNII